MLSGKGNEKRLKSAGLRRYMMKPGDLVLYLETETIGIVTRHSGHFPNTYVHVYFGWKNPFTKYSTPAVATPVKITALEVIR